MIITVNNQSIELDDEGYLKCLTDWTPEVAQALALQENIVLNQSHWQIIKLLREFYQIYQLSPANRPLAKYLSQHLGKEQASSLQLNLLFKGSPAKIAAKIAGLPKPNNCI